MTTVPGHNLVIQQSGTAQELSNQTQASKSSPEQATAQQEANELVKNSTVQEFDESEKVKTKKEKDEQRRRQELAQKQKKKQQEEKELDPDATGKLLDTTA